MFPFQLRRASYKTFAEVKKLHIFSFNFLLDSLFLAFFPQQKSAERKKPQKGSLQHQNILK